MTKKEIQDRLNALLALERSVCLEDSEAADRELLRIAEAKSKLRRALEGRE